MTNPAFTHAEEFLDESRDFADLPAVRHHALLKKARAVVMECATALRPQARPERAQASSAPLDFGLSLGKDPIFETTTEDPDWASGILFAIATAKKMGAENFEIQTREERGSGPGRGRSPLMYDMLFPVQQRAESWQSGSGVCIRITLFAVRIK